MNTYELTYIISSQISSQEADVVKNEVESFIQNKEGIVLRSGKMEAQPLSYAISKQGSGYFNSVVFQIEQNKIKEIKSDTDKNGKILRSIITIKKPVKEIKERRTRRPTLIKEFETKRKSFIMEPITKEDQKKGEKVDFADLDKKLDELLNE
ncbi:MAG: 30S ribosomal protein S6 [Patescibacteria group bacterium]